MGPYCVSGYLEGLFLLQISIKNNTTSKACSNILFPYMLLKYLVQKVVLAASAIFCM